MGGRLRSLSAVAALAVLALAAVPASGNQQELEAYGGLWQYADGDEGRQEIEVAIGRAIDDLPFFVEPFAADQIRPITTPFERVRFTVTGDRLAFLADGWGPVSSRVGGPPETIRDPVGSPLELQQSMRGSRLKQVFTSPDGQRENIFALSGDGRWIWMSVRISSPRLPADVRYRLRYRRADTAPTQHATR